MSDYGEVSYAVISDGDRHVITDAAIPLALELKSIIGSDHNWREMDSIPSYLGELDTEPRNEAVLVGAIVGAAVFFTSWVATKFLDEIYSMKFREPLRKALLAADQKFTGANATKPKVLKLGFSYSDKEVMFLIAIIGNSFEAILSYEPLIFHAHTRGVKVIEEQGVLKPVMLYLVEQGTISATPFLFETLNDAEVFLRRYEPTPNA